MLHAVMCELEGVLAETAPARREALQCAFADEGLALPTMESADALEASDSPALVRRALARLRDARDETAIDLLVLRVERHLATLLGRGISLVPGAREFVERAASEARLALVTRSTRAVVELVLQLGGLDGAFECIVAAEDVLAPKPSPAGYRRALERLARRRAIGAGSVLALEDTRAGVRAARLIGARTVGVAPSEAASLDAELVIPSVAGQSPASLAALLPVRKAAG
jgi:beta-phosphoglucomutase